MQEPAARKPWFASRMLRLSPSAAEMISPSWSAMGRPGHSFRWAQSLWNGVASMCATTSGWPVMDRVETCGGCVWMMHCTSGRCRYTQK